LGIYHTFQTNNDLFKLFSKYGEIKRFKLFNQKLFGYCEMVKHKDAKKAVAALNKTEMFNKDHTKTIIKCEPFKYNDKRWFGIENKNE